jgi:hypothetical protein
MEDCMINPPDVYDGPLDPPEKDERTLYQLLTAEVLTAMMYVGIEAARELDRRDNL